LVMVMPKAGVAGWLCFEPVRSKLLKLQK